MSWISIVWLAKAKRRKHIPQCITFWRQIIGETEVVLRRLAFLIIFLLFILNFYYFLFVFIRELSGVIILIIILSFLMNYCFVCAVTHFEAHTKIMYYLFDRFSFQSPNTLFWTTVYGFAWKIRIAIFKIIFFITNIGLFLLHNY